VKPATGFSLDRTAVARSFGRASAHYQDAARLQSAVGAELLERLQYFPLAPRVIVDLGAGTGRNATALRGRYPRARVIAIDLAFSMMQQARRRQRFWRRYDCVCADACALPLAAHSVDLVFCNLMLQWCATPAALFEQVQRALRPGGLLLFSSFGPGTLQELRAAWASVDEYSHVSDFANMPQLGAALTQAGMAEPVMDRELRVRYYADVNALMSELRTIGARHAAADRRRSLTGPRRLRAMAAAYEKLRAAPGLPASWEIICGAAFAGQTHPDSHGAAPLAGREIGIAVDAVQRRQR
jgi:malonyl-CoA O-methyltransferase